MQANETVETKQSMRPFLVLWSGQALSLLGSQLVQFALIWWLTQETGSATVLATASLVGLLPQVVLGPFVGVLVDRWNRRRTMMAADTIVALATVALAVFFWQGVADVAHVFAILFIRALAGAFHWPAMQASTSLMVPKQHLTRIQGLNQTLNGGLNIIAAPLGALLLGILPMQGILAIDVVTALFAITPLLFIDVPQPKRPATEAGVGDMAGTFWSEMGDGFSYVRRWRGLMLLLGLAVLLNFLLGPAFALLPLLVTDYFGGGAIQLGFLEAASGLGIVLGGAALGAWGGFRRRIVTSLVGLIGLGIGVLGMGLVPADWFTVAIGAALVVGFMMSMTNGPILAILQAVVTPEMQGRVFTLAGSLTAAMTPVGLLIAGPVADVVGVRSWYLAGGVMALLLGLGGFFMPSIMNLEDGRSQEGQLREEQSREGQPQGLPLRGAVDANFEVAVVEDAHRLESVE